MISFKTFVEETEVTATKRKGIQHFDQLKPLEFVELVEQLKQAGGVIPKGEATFTEKVDGFGLRFGVDKAGRPFIESSRSGPVFEKGHFENYAKSRGSEDLKIPMAYEDLFQRITGNKELVKLLKEYSEEGVKVVAECLYNPLGRHEDEYVEFIATKYDKSKLGKVATLVMFEALAGPQFSEKIEKSTELLSKITKLTNDDIKFTNLPSMKNENIELTAEIKSLEELVKDKDVKTLLKSRKGDDKAARAALEGALDEIKKKTLSKILDGLQQVGAFGPEYEGVVMKLPDGSLYKFISSRFKERKKEFNAEREKR